MSRHHKPSASSITGVQKASVHKLWNIILGSATADWFSINNYISDKQILIRFSALKHLQDVFHVDVYVSVTFKDEPEGEQTDFN